MGKGMLLHYVVIFMLCVSQGITQRILVHFSNTQRLSPSTSSGNSSSSLSSIIASISPIYLYSIKFLWAPLIDIGSTRTRRIQWIIPLQFLITIGISALWMFSNEGMGNWKWESTASLIFGLAFCSACQEMVITAWIPEAGKENTLRLLTMQFAGLLLGSNYIPISSDGEEFLKDLLQMGLFLCALTTISCLLDAVVTWKTSADPHESSRLSLFNTASLAARQSSLFRRASFLLLTRGIPAAALSILFIKLQEMSLVTSLHLSLIREYLMFVQFLFAPLAMKLVRRFGSERIVRWCTAVEYPCVLWGTYLMYMSSSSSSSVSDDHIFYYIISVCLIQGLSSVLLWIALGEILVDVLPCIHPRSGSVMAWLHAVYSFGIFLPSSAPLFIPAEITQDQDTLLLFIVIVLLIGYCSRFLWVFHPNDEGCNSQSVDTSVQQRHHDEEATDVIVDYRKRVEAMYKCYNPEKLDSVDNALQMYAGEEEKLMKALVKKYGPEPLS